MPDKKIYQFENKQNGDVHCYFDIAEDRKDWYKNTNRWNSIIRDKDWINVKLNELIKDMKVKDYVKVTYIFDKVKTSILKTKKEISNDISTWSIPKDTHWKNIFSFEIITPSPIDLFNYYFDPLFYKNIATEINDKDQNEEFEDVMEKYMAKTKASIFCEPLSGSLTELFEGEEKPSDKSIDISFINSRFNLSQFRAIEKSLTMPTTIIKGPPGTGKTTTLLNIIISAFLNNKTVLVSSKNNKAVDNILESLEEYNFDKFWFRFGNNDKLKSEFEKIRSFPIKNEEDEHEIPTDNIDVYNSLKELISKNEDEATIKESLMQWGSFKKHLKNRIKKECINIEYDKKIVIPKRRYQNKLLNYLLWFTLKNKNKRAIIQLNDIKKELYLDKNTLPIISNDNFEASCLDIKKHLSLLGTYKNITLTIEKLFKSKTDIDFEKEWSTIKTNDTYYKDVVLNVKNHIKEAKEKRNKVIETINKKSGHNRFTLNTECSFNQIFRKNFMRAFPIHFVTNLSIYKLPNIKYDYVILDEAGQSDIQSTIGLLQKGKHNILCGDEAQLEPIYKMSKLEDDKLAKKYDVDSMFRANDNSLLSIYSKFLSTDRISFLNEHYRCPPEVIKFSNNEIYHKQLKIMTKNENSDEVISILDVNGKVQQDKWINNDEISAIVDDIQKSGIDHSKIAVISPFRDQVRAMKSHPFLKDVAVDTIFKFQGREFDYVYFTTVLGSRMNYGGNEYLNKSALINVALTRTKKKFILVSNVKPIQEKDPESLIARLQSYIIEKKFNIQTDTKEDIEAVWAENITNNDILKTVTITPLFKKLQHICKKHELSIAINTKYSDIFKMDINNKAFKKLADYVIYNHDGNIIFAVAQNKVIFKTNDIFDDLDLKEELIKDFNIKRILTSREISFKKIIEELISKDEIIMPTVKLSSVIKLCPKLNLSKWMMESANSMHFDFVIYKINNDKLIPLKVIELDDITHKNDEAKKRDERKDWFALLAKIKIKRFISYKY